ncbi:MAG: hypothetical protein E7213_03750 [Clostridium sp.]|nr:hypothetical protein [Clostridium sp.]
MLNAKKIAFPIGMILIIAPKIVDEFIMPVSKNVRIVFAIIGLVVVVLGSIISEREKKKQSK